MSKYYQLLRIFKWFHEFWMFIESLSSTITDFIKLMCFNHFSVWFQSSAATHLMHCKSPMLISKQSNLNYLEICTHYLSKSFYWDSLGTSVSYFDEPYFEYLLIPGIFSNDQFLFTCFCTHFIGKISLSWL